MLNLSKIKWIVVSLILFGVFIVWPIKIMTKPLPGEAIEDLGREHVTDIFDIEYNSNPPTSGTHFPMWAKSGVYDRLISDGYLIHSMEHGYVILWYDCTKPLVARNSLFTVSAHDEPTEESSDSGQLLKHMNLTPSADMSAFTPENQPVEEVPLPEEFKSESCKSLVNGLSKYLTSFQRIIVAPRVDMETPITLTAWNRRLRLDKVDDKKILEFVKAFHNKGPEKTIED